MHTGKYQSDEFPTENGMKERSFITVAFQIYLEYTITRVQEKEERLKLKGTH
jgi:hypothetical protein